MVEFFAFFPASLCGVLVFCCALPFVSRLSPSVAFALLYSHTTLSDTHATSSHTTLSHTTYSQQLTRTQLSYTHTRTHTHNSLTHNSLARNSHTQLSHTQLSHTHTTYSHTTLSHTTGVAGVALGDIDLRVMRQARRLWHWASSGGPLGFRWRSCRRGCLCIAGVALRDIGLLSVSGR